MIFFPPLASSGYEIGKSSTFLGVFAGKIKGVKAETSRDGLFFHTCSESSVTRCINDLFGEQSGPEPVGYNPCWQSHSLSPAHHAACDKLSPHQPVPSRDLTKKEAPRNATISIF